MINENLLGYHAIKYRALSTKVTKEYKNCPWADNFVEGFAKWLQKVKVFTWKNGVMPKSAQSGLDAFLGETLPPQLFPELQAKMRGKGTTQVSLIGFLMGRALALAALDHEYGGVPSVTDLQYRWWSYPGFTSVIIEDVVKNKETSCAYRMARQWIEWLEAHPEKGIIGTRERQQFSQLCESWHTEGTLAGLWDNSFGWQHFSATRFEESIISDLLAVATDLILPLLDTIRIPTIMDNIFRDTHIQYNPILLQTIIRDAPPCTDMDENSTVDVHAAPKTPAWNGSIVAASILSFIVEYAQALLGERETEDAENTQEATAFLKACAESMIARRDGLYLAKHFVRELHHNMRHQPRGGRCSALFLEAIVDAVENQGKSTLLMRWMVLEHEEKLKNFPEAEWERFIQTGLQSKKQDSGELEALVAHARLLPLVDLQGAGGAMLREAYERLFCTVDTGFYTSEYSNELPSPMHEALAWIFVSTHTDNLTEKWEQTWDKLGAAANRIFRDFFYKDRLNLMYVLNFHLAVGLAVADSSYMRYGAGSAKKVIHRLLEHLLDRLRLADRIDAFYRKMVRILVCKLYLYLHPTKEEQGQYAILAELAGCLRAMQSIPMLAFESMESLTLNGLEVKDIKSCAELKTVAIEAYEAAQEHDANDHWKIRRGDEKIARACEKMLAQLRL